MGISNYSTIDSLILQVFPYYNVGSTMMISTTENEILGASMFGEFKEGD